MARNDNEYKNMSSNHIELFVNKEKNQGIYCYTIAAIA